MKKILILLFFIFINASNLNNTKQQLFYTQKNISIMNEKLKNLVKKIEHQQNYLNKLNQQIKNLNIQLESLKEELINSNSTLSNLIDLKKGYEEKLHSTQEEITTFLSENFLNNIAHPQNINDLIEQELSKQILKKYSIKISKILQQNRKIQKEIENINKKIENILKLQKQYSQKKEKLAMLLKKQKKEILMLKKQKQIYKNKLKQLVQKQKNLQKTLSQLNVVSTQPTTKLTQEEVKKYGSVYIKPKISNYKGTKTIPPLRGKIIKKFGSYIDPIYKIRIYNPSITIKAYRPNSVVRSIFNGKVIYIGETSFNKKIVVIKHKNHLFSIYANLDKISPIIKKGYHVKKGQIIGRVKNTLDFEITYKDRPINPLKVINLK